MRSESTGENSSYIIELIKTLIVALILSLLLILLTALLIKLFNISNSAIPVINQIIKGLSILLSCIFCLKGNSNGWVRGVVAGLLYIMLAYIVFSLLDGEFTFGINILNDAALGCITGLISGIIAVNLRKSRD